MVQSDEMAAQIAQVVRRVSEIQVTSADEYADASAYLVAIKARQKGVIEYFAPMKAKARAAWQEVLDKEKAELAKVDAAEVTLKTKLLEYRQAQEAIREAEQRRLQAEADAAAERERQRLLREADKLRTPELAEARREQAAAVVAPAIVVAPAAPKVAGQSVRTMYRARVTSKGRLILAAAGVFDPSDAAIAAAEQSPAGAMLTADDSAANRLAAATKGAVRIPGIEFYAEQSIAQYVR